MIHTPSQSSDTTAVIGAGLGGLAAACTLAARGHKVILFERNDWAGGKAAIHAEDGFRFDMGPTILTLPSVLHRIFGEAGRKVSDYMDMVRLDPQWRCFFDDGSVLDLKEDVERMVRDLEAYAPGSGTGYRKFMELSRRLHRISDNFFFWKPIGGLKDMFNTRSSFQAGTLSDVLSMRMHSTVAGTIHAKVKDVRVGQMLEHFTQYVGSAPDASPSVLCGIAHMQTDEGIWYPVGGTGAVPAALLKLAGELGVDVRLGCGISRILSADGQVEAVETDSGEKVPVASVVSNSDVVRSHRELLNKETRERFEKRKRHEPACSGVVLYLGLNKRYPHLLHHNFVFSRDPKEEFDAIYRQGEPAPDPTCYVCAPAATEPAVAPEGGEALYVLVHTPYLRPHHNWSKMLPEYRRAILEKLKKTAGMEDIEERIVHESTLTPEDIDRRYHVLNGAIYGLASHGRLLGAFKPSNRSPDMRGLYFSGGSAHPGPGMPMVLMSGWIAGDTVNRDTHPADKSSSTPASAIA